MTSEELNPKVLGQLLLMQSVLNNLPDNKSIFSFVCKGLLDIPGIAKVNYRETKTIQVNNFPSELILPITLGESFYGEIIILLSETKLFKPYEHYLNNFIFMIGVILEERKQRHLIEEHKFLLEKRIVERTIELQEKNDEIEAQNEEYLQINEELNQTNNELLQAKGLAEESHHLFYSLFHQAAVGVAIINSETGRFIQINKKYCQICGYTENEMLEADFMSITHPDDLELDLSKMRNLKNGEINEFSINKRYIKKDNSTIWIRLTVSPLEKVGDTVLTHIAIVEDISDRKRFELELEKAKQKSEENEEKFRLMIKNSNDAFVLINEKGEQYYISDAAKRDTGFEIDELKGPLQKVIYPDDLETVIEAWKEVLSKEGEIIRVQYRHKHKFKDYIWYEAVAQNFINNPAINAVVVNVRDISAIKATEAELRKAKEKAEESDRLKTAFLQNMSHELRTPLNAISGFAGMLNKPDLAEEKRKSFISIIQNSSTQLISIVSDILTISSLETKQEKVNFNKVCINDIIVDLLSIFREQTINKNISLYAKQPLNDRQSEIYTDKTKTTQILTNLLSNSLKFTYEGVIEFGYQLVETDDLSSLQFYVKDSGIGIKPEFHEKIFERFRQADKSINKLYGGTGLGLAISKAFVELLGGKIWVESEAEKGSTFYFTIPYKPVNEIGESKIPTKQSENSITILVAEDEEYNFLLIEELLSDLDFKLIHSKDGQETVDICRTNPNIDLILMDIKMPIMDGHTAARLIKEFRPALPIIAQSAYALEHEIEKFRGIFDDYITKPINEEELLQNISRFINMGK